MAKSWLLGQPAEFKWGDAPITKTGTIVRTFAFEDALMIAIQLSDGSIVVSNSVNVKVLAEPKTN